MLPDWQISKLVWPDDGKQIVRVPPERVAFGPIHPSQIQPASLDVRLGEEFISHPSGRLIVPLKYLLMEPGECLLATLVERFALPDHLVARVEGKSTWARKFLTVHSAGFIDPGFCGDITMELKNDGKSPIKLTPGDVIAQVSFQFLDAPARRPYGSEGLGSHYQNQIGPTAARS